MKLMVEFTHFWHCGSGYSGGKKVDALVEKDKYQIAYVPGKTLKGILRQAVHQAESYGVYNTIKNDQSITLENLLFGSRDESREHQYSGLLAVSDASLSEQERQYLYTHKQKIPLLYRTINRTAISQKSGVAIDGSLRSQEVTIPMILTAELDILDSLVDKQELSESRQAVKAKIKTIINAALPYVDGIGSLRQRGLGRCLLSLEL